MGLLDPRIDVHLISQQGEVVIDEVRKHWAAIVWAVLEMVGGGIVMMLTFFVPTPSWWVPALIGGIIVFHASLRILEQRMDRFIITNMRVFRVHGILSQNIATMPLARILDISVHKPLIGRVFGYGHFVFESAAQEQGLREIRFVGDPDRRGLTIQTVIAEAGLRGLAGRQAMGDPSLAPMMPPRPPAPARPAAEAAHEYERAAGGWDWLAHAQQREEARLAELRRVQNTEVLPQYDPDRSSTDPIELPAEPRVPEH